MAILRLKNQSKNLYLKSFKSAAMDTWFSTSIKLLFMFRSAHVCNMKKLRHSLLMTQVFIKQRISKQFLIFIEKDSRGQGISCTESQLWIRNICQLFWLQILCLTTMLSLSSALNFFKFFATNNMKKILSICVKIQLNSDRIRKTSTMICLRDSVLWHMN